MTHDDNAEVYNNLTEENKNEAPKKWTLYLFLCCVTAAMASFQFGFNIGVTNLPTPLIKEFYSRRYHPAYVAERNELNKNKADLNLLRSLQEELDKAKSEAGESKAEIEAKIKSATENLNITSNLETYLNTSLTDLADKEVVIKKKGDSVENMETFLWTITTAAFVVGGIIGGFTSKYVADFFGRKKGIIFHYIFTIAGAILTGIAPSVNSPECIIISRLLFGIQGGMSCGLIPTYLTEISPGNLRGATGVIHQLGITIGIFVSQLLGFRQILGKGHLWPFLLAIPAVPAIVGGIFLLLFFPETPRALLINNKDEESARKALHRLRNTTDVGNEIEAIKQEAREQKSDENISFKELFTSKEYRWPLITGLVLQLTQQLCGINAIFFYSESIFKNAGILQHEIQYAVLLTGIINVIVTIAVIPLIDRLGRKPLLVFPMLIIIVDFIALTVFLVLQDKSKIFSYLSIACIILFIVCFAVGLGPIPFVYVAECFRQDARSSALAICMFTNWMANLALTLSFPYLAIYLKQYVFLVFTVIVAFAVFVIFKKVPETKGRTTDEIMASFLGRKARYDAESSGKLMSNTKV